MRDTDEIQKIETKDSPIKIPNNPETPRTCDAYRPVLLLGGIVLGLAMLGISVVREKKKRH